MLERKNLLLYTILFTRIYLIKFLTKTLLGTSLLATYFKLSCFALAQAISVRALKDLGSQIDKSASTFRFSKILHLISPSLRVTKLIPC